MQQVIRFLASARLSMVLLALAMVLVYVGTWAQVDTGIQEVQRRYFHSWAAKVPLGVVLPRTAEGQMLVPGGVLFPGGYTIGLLMLVNLVANWFTRFRWGWKQAGIHLIHAGLVLLLVGEAWSSLAQVDSRMVLSEGQRANYTVDPRRYELAVIDRAPGDHDRVWAVNHGELHDGKEVADSAMPVSLRIDRFAGNTRLAGPMEREFQGQGEALANAGAGRGVRMLALSPAGGVENQVDTPSAFVTVLQGGQERGTYLLSLWQPLDAPQQVALGDGRELWLQLRQKRYYKPYAVELVEFRHDRYAGTGMAKNFSSRVRVIDPAKGVDREELIWMNHPLRYGGETYYQASFDGEDTTVLQVVRNPAVAVPYVACVIGSAGLLLQLGVGLRAGLRKKEQAAAGALPMVAAPSTGMMTVVVPTVVGALCIAFVGAKAITSQVQKQDMSQVPVYHDGRLQPLDSVARNSLRVINGRASAVTADGTKLTPVRWLLDVLMQPAKAQSYPVVRIDNADVRSALRLPVDRKTFSLAELQPASDVLIEQATRAHELPQGKRELVQRQFIELANAVTLHLNLQNWREMRFVPPVNGGDWRSVTVAGAGDPLGKEIAQALAAGGAIESEPAAARWLQGLRQQQPDVMTRMQLEVFYNRYEPFTVAMVMYVLAFLLACISMLSWQKPLWRSAMVLAVIALGVHTAALAMRIYLQGRPPVTNLYSSAIFIGWGAVLSALLAERAYRNGVAIGMASLIATGTLTIAQQLAQGGDTMASLQAVLDSNFWLTTHVLTITYGYSAVFVAGGIGLAYVLGRLFAPQWHERNRAGLARMVYGISCFALLFSFIGTVLGGIWADQSWGRFWGWDPKENGAVLIVLWLAIMLHARLAGGKDRSLALMAIFGNVVTAWSWFGTNMLGVGLHSYGFMDAALRVLLVFVTSQLLLIMVGWMVIPAEPAEALEKAESESGSALRNGVLDR